MSHQIDRLTVTRGPALVSYGGGAFLSKEDMNLDFEKQTKPIPSSAFGPLTYINTAIKRGMKFTPVGLFEHLDVLWTPFASMKPGTSIFGSADTELLIQPIDTTQKQVRFHAAAVSKPPGLKFTTQDTLIKEVEFQMVGKNNTAVDDPNYIFTFEDNTLSSVPYTPDDLIIEAYDVQWMDAGTVTWTYGADSTSALAWDISAADLSTALNALTSITSAGGVTVSGSVADGWKITFNDNGTRTNFTGALDADFPGGTSFRQDILTTGDTDTAQVVLIRLYPWNNFNSREGVDVEFTTTLTEDKSDAIGHYDTIFRSLEVKATLIPQGVLDADAMNAAAIQGANSVVGSRLSVGAHDFNIFGDGVYFRLYAANIRKAGLVYSSEKQRLPAFEWFANRSVQDGGAINPLFFIGSGPPE